MNEKGNNTPPKNARPWICLTHYPTGLSNIPLHNMELGIKRHNFVYVTACNSLVPIK